MKNIELKMQKEFLYSYTDLTHICLVLHTAGLGLIHSTTHMVLLRLINKDSEHCLIGLPKNKEPKKKNCYSFFHSGPLKVPLNITFRDNDLGKQSISLMHYYC